MFISKELQKLLSGYRKFTGNRIYAIYDTMPQKDRRKERTREVCEMLRVPYKRAERAITWGIEKKQAHLQEEFKIKQAA